MVHCLGSFTLHTHDKGFLKGLKMVSLWRQEQKKTCFWECRTPERLGVALPLACQVPIVFQLCSVRDTSLLQSVLDLPCCNLAERSSFLVLESHRVCCFCFCPNSSNSVQTQETRWGELTVQSTALIKCWVTRKASTPCGSPGPGMKTTDLASQGQWCCAVLFRGAGDHEGWTQPCRTVHLLRAQPCWSRIQAHHPHYTRFAEGAGCCLLFAYVTSNLSQQTT